MSAADQHTMQLTAQCLCRKHTFTTHVLRSSLPFNGTSCHCDSCRHLTGAMNINVVLWPGDHDAIQSAALKRYRFSDTMLVYFCPTCFSNMFWEIRDHDEATGKPNNSVLKVFTGVLQADSSQNLINITDHIFVGDTLDGGASMWMRRGPGGGPPARRWHGARLHSEELAHEWPGPSLHADRSTVKALRDVSFGCRCGGVDLVYHRSKADEEFAAVRTEDLPRHVNRMSRKPDVDVDACDSCRIASGSEFFCWTSSFLRHIGFGGQLTGGLVQIYGRSGFPTTVTDLYAAVLEPEQRRDSRLGTLAVYCSSEGVKRFFCSRCSACVFFALDAKPDVVDIAMGLFKSPDGARAEEVFQWSSDRPFLHRKDLVGGWREDWLKSTQAQYEAWDAQHAVKSSGQASTSSKL